MASSRFPTFRFWIRAVFLSIPLSVAAQLGPDSLRFAIIADPQYADKTSTTDRCYRNTIAKMNTAITFLNSKAPAFLLILGDYVDGYTAADSAITVRDINALNVEVSKFQGPVYQVMGNHDEASLNKSEWLQYTYGVIKKNYYSFDVGPIHFIVLDGNYTPNGKDYGRIDPWVWTDTQIPAEQKAWLIANLDSAGQKPTIIAIHQNIHDQTDYSLDNSTEIRQILQTHGNVTHVLQGHRHEGAYAQVSGIHYVTQQAMVNCPASVTGTGNNYALVVIKDSAMYIDGYGGTPDRTLIAPGLRKAAWTTSLQESPQTSFAWNPIELSDGYLRFNMGGPHEIFVHDLNGQLISSRKGDGATAYALTDLNAANPGTVYVFTARTTRGVFSKKLIRP